MNATRKIRSAGGNRNNCRSRQKMSMSPNRPRCQRPKARARAKARVIRERDRRLMKAIKDQIVSQEDPSRTLREYNWELDDLMEKELLEDTFYEGASVQSYDFSLTSSDRDIQDGYMTRWFSIREYDSDYD